MFFFATTFTLLSEWSRTRYRNLNPPKAHVSGPSPPF